MEYEADPKHRKMVLEYFGLDASSRKLAVNGDKMDKAEDGDEEVMEKEEATAFRGLAARLNFLSQDSPDLQFGIKPCSQMMANPTVGSWKVVKKVARYLVGREAVVWKFGWQDEPRHAYVASDSDWGGTAKDRKSTSGGVWMLGGHLIKSWSATQQAYALSSAEAELYACRV